MATTPKPTVNKDDPASGIFSNFPAALVANLPNMPMNGSASWWQAYMTGAAEMNSEFMKFVTTRLQHDAALGQSLATCSDWSDAASIHQEWVQTMSEEYMGEAQTLMQIASTTAQSSLTASVGGSDDADNQLSQSSDK